MIVHSTFAEGIEYITNVVRDDIESMTNFGRPIPVKIKVMATLRYLGSSSLQLSVADTLGMSQSSVSRCVHRVRSSLYSKVDDYIHGQMTLIQQRMHLLAWAGFQESLVPLMELTCRFKNRKIMQMSSLIANVIHQSMYVLFVTLHKNSLLYLFDDRAAVMTVSSCDKQSFGIDTSKIVAMASSLVTAGTRVAVSY